jgi:hypothetical protein
MSTKLKLKTPMVVITGNINSAIMAIAEVWNIEFDSYLTLDIPDTYLVLWKGKLYIPSTIQYFE